MLHAINAKKVDDDEDACGNAIMKNNSKDDVQGDDGIKAIAEKSDEKTKFPDLTTDCVKNLAFHTNTSQLLSAILGAIIFVISNGHY